MPGRALRGLAVQTNQPDLRGFRMTLPDAPPYHNGALPVKSVSPRAATSTRAGVMRGRAAWRSALLDRIELAASVDALVPSGAPIVSARYWDGHLCAGCGRLGEPLTYLTMRWSNARGAHLRALRCAACGPLLDALASLWTREGPGRLVSLSGPLCAGGE